LKPVTFRRLGPFVALAVLALIAWRTGLLALATPAGLHAHAPAITAATRGHPAAALAVFVLFYAVLTATCLPVALALTLTAGALFGVWQGAAAALAGGGLGASATYLAARYASVGSGEGDTGRIAQAAQALRGDAFPLILAARLFPFMPYAVVNIASGLAAAPVRAYLPATILGSIPSAFIYSELGDRFGHVLMAGRWPDLSLMREPGVLVPLVGLALLSLAGAVVKHRLDRGKA
jgi:uncharacterized membrane protein YdjX (TVP38/TMEM64 family)